MVAHEHDLVEADELSELEGAPLVKRVRKEALVDGELVEDDALALAEGLLDDVSILRRDFGACRRRRPIEGWESI